MSEISLDRNELATVVQALEEAGSRFSRSTLRMGGRRSTISAVGVLIETFAMMEEGFMATGEAVRCSAAVLAESGQMIASEDIAAAGRFEG